MDATLLRELLLQRLPVSIHMVLTPSAEVLNLDQLAQLADRIVETSPTPKIAATTDTTSKLAAQVADLTKRLDQLTSQMSKTISSLSRRSRLRSPARRQRGNFTSKDSDDGLCWYHRKFGDDVKKCTPPCQKAETIRPDAFSDERYWPFTQSPTIFN